MVIQERLSEGCFSSCEYVCQDRELASVPLLVGTSILSGLPSVRKFEMGVKMVSGRRTNSFFPFPTEWHLQREPSQHRIEKLGRERLSDLVPHPGMFQCQYEKRRMKP